MKHLMLAALAMTARVPMASAQTPAVAPASAEEIRKHDAQAGSLDTHLADEPQRQKRLAHGNGVHPDPPAFVETLFHGIVIAREALAELPPVIAAPDHPPRQPRQQPLRKKRLRTQLSTTHTWALSSKTTPQPR